jgi:hypothetical protein
MKNKIHFYAPLQKIEKNDDGTLRVHGIASTESVDSDGEVITSDAMEEALPDFFKHGTGALREMHQPIAAGTVDEAEVDGGVTRIVATIVDAEAVKKVELGVYKGFSIGGRVKERDAKNRKVVTKITLAEISLVDRPSNPDAVLSIFKLADYSDEPSAADKALTAMEDLQKALAAKFPKLEPLDPIAERDRTIALLEKRLAEAMDEPLPPKTAGPAAANLIGTPGFSTPYEKMFAKGHAPQVRAVDKGTDAAGGASGPADRPELDTESIRKYLDSLPEEERVLSLMKAAQSQPLALAHRPAPRPGSVLESLTGAA